MSMRILGLDVGEKRIGMAVSDEEGRMALGLETLIRKEHGQDIGAIKAVIEEYGVKKIVTGLPLNMDGTMGRKGEEAVCFAEMLRDEFRLPVETWDERLSSCHGERVLLDADVSRKKRKKVIDKLAAQIILQNYLDARNTTGV